MPRRAWHFKLRDVAIVLRSEAIACFAVLACALYFLILPWALDTHPLIHLHGMDRPAIRVTRHASILIRLAATAFLIALLAVATVAHELGHALALRRAGASEITVTLYGAGGVCRAVARDTSPFALLWYAAAGPLVTLTLVLAMLAMRVLIPGPHAVRVALWLTAAIQAGTLAINVVPLIARSDGGHMLNALATLAGRHHLTRYLCALAISAPALALFGTLQSSVRMAALWGAVSVLLAAVPARLAWDLDRRAPAMQRTSVAGRAIAFWLVPALTAVVCRQRPPACARERDGLPPAPTSMGRMQS